MQTWHFVVANIGLWLGVSFPHKKAQSSNPTGPTGPVTGNPLGLLLALTQA